MAAPHVWQGGEPLPPRASIVVMPFNNFSGDRTEGYVADAITDDLTTDLARLKGTFVIARNTAFTFKGRSVNARDVGKECGVRYMLEGSITRAGNQIETNVQLIDTQTGAHVWADRFVHHDHRLHRTGKGDYRPHRDLAEHPTDQSRGAPADGRAGSQPRCC